MGVFTRDSEPAPAKALPYSAHRPVTAAAQRVNMTDKSEVERINKRRSNSGWQDDAWEYYDLVGEIKFAYRLFSNVMSRIRLYVGVVDDEGQPPVPIEDSDISEASKDAARRAFHRAFSPTNQPDMLRKATTNMLVAGECYLVQMPPKYGVRDKEQWKIVSIDELVTRSGGDGRYKLKTERNQRDNDMETLNSTFVGRVWSEHARYSDEADSSMRALVDLCDELFLFQRAARATARSRLNAGALFVPDDLSVSADQTTVEADPVSGLPNDNDDSDEFEQELLDAMTTPISDEGSAASIVPLLIRGPAEAGAAIKLIKFERSFDPQLAQRAERALDRILAGLDMPKDMVTGMSKVKYSNAASIEESFYVQHVEPLVLMLCDAFRLVYLDPALAQMNVDPTEAEKIVIWYDPSGIMTAPDKSNAANVGFDKFALSWEAWRRANGFVNSDAPDALEIAQRIAVQRGQLSPEITEELLKTLIPEVLAATRAQSLANSPSPMSPEVQQMLGGPQPPASPDDHPTGPQPPGSPDDHATSGSPPPLAEPPDAPTPPVSGP